MVNVIELYETSPASRVLITNLRDENTKSSGFNYGLRRFGELCALQVLNREPQVCRDIVTGNSTPYTGSDFQDKEHVVIAILRAADPMTEGLMSGLLGHGLTVDKGYIGASRGEGGNSYTPPSEGGPAWNFKYKLNYVSVPSTDGKVAHIVDPMLASGGTLLLVPREVMIATPEIQRMIGDGRSIYDIRSMIDQHDLPEINLRRIIHHLPSRWYLQTLNSARWGVDRVVDHFQQLSNWLAQYDYSALGDTVLITGQIDTGE